MTEENVENIEENTETVETTEPVEKNKDSSSLLNSISEDEGNVFDFTNGRPDNFPEDFWDADSEQPDINKIYNEMKNQQSRADGLRAKLSKGVQNAPENPEAYKVDFGDDLADVIPQDDPLVVKAKDVAHKYGLSQESFEGFMSDMVKEMYDFSQTPREMTEEEIQQNKEEQYSKIGENAPQVIRAVASWGKSMQDTGFFSESDYEAFETMAVTGEQVRVLNKLRARISGVNDIPMDIVDDGLPSDDEIATMMNDAYTSKDKKSIDKVNELLNRRRQAGRPERLQTSF